MNWLIVPKAIVFQTLFSYCYLAGLPETDHDSLVYSKYQLVSLTVGQLDKSLKPREVDSKIK